MDSKNKVAALAGMMGALEAENTSVYPKRRGFRKDIAGEKRKKSRRAKNKVSRKSRRKNR